MKTSRFGQKLLSVAVAIAATASFLPAASIVYNNMTTDDTGTGFGSIFTLLQVSAFGSDSIEWGSRRADMDGDRVLNVPPAGAAGNASNQSGNPMGGGSLWTVADLTAGGVNQSNFRVIFNINEDNPPKDVILRDWTLRFYTNPGMGGDWSASFFDVTYDAPADVDGGKLFSVVGNGQGGAGHIFELMDMGGLISNWWSDPTNRIGAFNLSSQVIGTNDPTQLAQNRGISNGAENFYIVAIPEPSVNLVRLLGVILALGTRRRR